MRVNNSIVVPKNFRLEVSDEACIPRDERNDNVGHLIGVIILKIFSV